MLKQLESVLALFSPERLELSVPDIARLLQRPRSTAYRLLAQIQAAGFLDRDEETGLFRLGIRLAALGEIAQRSTSLQRLALPVLRELSRQTGETATLLLLLDGEGTAVLHSESALHLMTKGVLGRYWPLHASAGGKALLAWRPETEAKALLKKPLARYTPTTIVSVAALQQEWLRTRKRGYATVCGEFVQDVWGVAVPIFNYRGEIEGAITLGGPSSRVTKARLPKLGKILITSGRDLSRALGYAGAYPRNTTSPDTAIEQEIDGEGLSVSQSRPPARRSSRGSEARLEAHRPRGRRSASRASA